MSSNWTTETINIPASGTGSSVTGLPLTQAQQARRVISMEESEQTEKTLHHLVGRVQELRQRLERVLVPARPEINGSGSAGAPVEAASPLTDRLRSFRQLAQDSIVSIEDILNRLDV